MYEILLQGGGERARVYVAFFPLQLATSLQRVILVLLPLSIYHVPQTYSSEDLVTILPTTIHLALLAKLSGRLWVVELGRQLSGSQHLLDKREDHEYECPVLT